MFLSWSYYQCFFFILSCFLLFRGDPPQGKLYHLSSEFQRCLLAPREMDVELKCFALTAPPLPNLKSTFENFEVVLNVSVETESWSAIPPRRRSSCILNSTCRLTGNAQNSEQEQQKELSFHIECPDGASLARWLCHQTTFYLILTH